MVSRRIFDSYLSIALVVSLNTILISGTDPELKLINVVFRHGDRAPDKEHEEMYPNDPYLNYSFYPEGLGQLTNRGKLREYELGQALNNRYNKFLGKVYLPKLVVSRSTDYDRTKMSLQLVLAGLFPPVESEQQWNPDLMWQPIPATYVPGIDDNLMYSEECPKYLEEYDKILELPEAKKRIAEFNETMIKLTELTGKDMGTPTALFYLFHTFMAEYSSNLTLPEWANKYFPNGQLLDAIVMAYDFASYNTKLRRLYGGPLVRAMSENMIAAQNPNPPSTKIYLYSGHETNIAALLHTFDVYKPHAPAYSSAVILELLEQDKQHYVKLVYYRGIPPEFKDLQIPGCEILCPFKKFRTLTHDLIPSDEEMECDKTQTPAYAGMK